MKSRYFHFGFRMFLGLVLEVVAVVYLFQIKGNPTTLDQAVYNFNHLVTATYWFLLGLFWVLSATVYLNQDRIEELEKRIEALEKEKGE